MPLVERAKALLARQNYCNNYPYDNNCYYYSPWDIYGRWILVAAIIVGAFLIFLTFSCITARRRRRNGMQPFRGTGWASRPPQGFGQAQYAGAPGQQPYGYNANANNNAGAVYGGPGGPPPQYNATPNAGFYAKPNDNNQSPYGGQQNGVELQTPQHAYQPQRGGDSVYAPPAGAPPGKGDGIVR